MSGITVAATAVIATAATVVIASISDAQALLSPITEGSEFTIVAASILATIPVLAAMTFLAASGRE